MLCVMNCKKINKCMGNQQCNINRAVFVRFSLGVGGGGSEFRLATSDYSGHGGCKIGTVEWLAKLDHVGLYRGVSGV